MHSYRFRNFLPLSLLAVTSALAAQQGPPAPLPGQMPFMHDPSTVIRDHGTYYVFSTGRDIPVLTSPDGISWSRAGSILTKIPDAVVAAAPGNDGHGVWAPDIIKVGNQFLLYYAVSKWGSFESAVGLVTSPTLDPKDPAYHWTDRGVVVQSVKDEDLNAIDPGAIQAPDGSLWLSYGSYHGTIQLIELDPKTGLRLHSEKKATVIASASESSDIIAHNGYFYLITNHGSCCQGQDSAYNLRVGRSRTITGPYLDKQGRDMAAGAGSLFLAGHDKRIGPGHFGRVIEEGTEAAPAERFSLHYEADMAHEGRSALDIRPLLWSSDGWPVPGDHLPPGPYQIRSAVSEDVLDLHVDLPPRPPRVRPAGAPGAPGAPPAATPPPLPPPAPFVAKPTVLRIAAYVTLDDQRWTIAPVEGGYAKIVNLMTGDALEASPQAAVTFAPYTGAPDQLWQLDQLPDSTYRIRNKASRLTLTAPDRSAPDHPNAPLATAFKDDMAHRWIIATP